MPFRTQPFLVTCQVADVQHFGDVGQMVCVGRVFEVRVSQPLCQHLREVTALEQNRKPLSNSRWRQFERQFAIWSFQCVTRVERKKITFV